MKLRAALALLALFSCHLAGSDSLGMKVVRVGPRFIDGVIESELRLKNVNDVPMSVKSCSIEFPSELNFRRDPDYAGPVGLDMNLDLDIGDEKVLLLPKILSAPLKAIPGLLFVRQYEAPVRVKCNVSFAQDEGTLEADFAASESLALDPPRYAGFAGVGLGYLALVALSLLRKRAPASERALLGLQSPREFIRYLLLLFIVFLLLVWLPATFERIPVKLDVHDMYGGLVLGLFTPLLVSQTQRFLAHRAK